MSIARFSSVSSKCRNMVSWGIALWYRCAKVSIVTTESLEWKNMVWCNVMRIVSGDPLRPRSQQNPLSFSESPILSQNRRNFRLKFRSLTFVKFYVLEILQESTQNLSNNVYIFLMAYSRPFKKRVNHVHTTFLGDSVSLQLGCKI